MTDINAVKKSVSEWMEPKVYGEWVVVPTTCAYPSNRTVLMYLSGGQETVHVYDGGGALDELDGSGNHGMDSVKLLKGFARRAGLTIDQRGWLGLEPVRYSDLSSAIPYLAKMSAEAASFAMRHRKFQPAGDLREDVDRLLVQKYDKRVLKRCRLPGASNKQHAFDFMVELPNARLAIDAALPEPSSINAIVVRNMDLTRSRIDGLHQLIVYDDREDSWNAEDLALLRVGARTYAFSHLAQVLGQWSVH